LASALAERGAEQVGRNAHEAGGAIRCRHRRDLVITYGGTGATQTRPDDAHEIARLHAPAAEPFGERHKIVGAECGFEFGKRPEREHQASPRAAKLRLDLSAMAIGHGVSFLILKGQDTFL
jgi:hypothetical protein